MSTSLSWILTPKCVGNTAVVLQGEYTSDQIMLLGSTMPTSVCSTSSDYHSSIVFYPEKNKKGLIAVTVVRWGEGKYGQDKKVSAFLEVVWKDGDNGTFPWIDVKTLWFPSSRNGQASPFSIEVEIKGRRFTSYEGKKGISYVSDSDLLCRYLFGLAKADEVIHAAVEEKKEAKAQEQLSVFQEEIERLNLQDLGWQEEVGNRDETIRDLNKKVATLGTEVDGYKTMTRKNRLQFFFDKLE